MKPCGTCGQTLPKESFSKKQWQSKNHRRCKHCIKHNQQVVCEVEPNLALLSLGETAANDAPRDPRSNNSLMPGCDDDRGVKVWTDEDLFREPPPSEDCPICFICLPLNNMEIVYQSCCGKIICIGCMYSFTQLQGNRPSCPFCRSLAPPTEREAIKRLMKRAKDNDPNAICALASYYHFGLKGLPRNHGKAMELWLRAGKLGNARSYGAIGTAYYIGDVIEANMEKAEYYFELAAVGGFVGVRSSLGFMELEKGDADRAVKHYMISAGCGDDSSVTEIRKLYAQGLASKGDFENALRAYGEARAETRSEQRDAAAADPSFNPT